MTQTLVVASPATVTPRALSMVTPYPQASDWRPNHNSIGFGAAKQAAPPRGVPR